MTAPNLDLAQSIATDTVELERMAARLEASADYRILRRLPPVPDIHPAGVGPTRRAVFVDVETTGLDPTTDAVIELAMAGFDYSEDGRIVGVGEVLQRFSRSWPAHPASDYCIDRDNERDGGRRLDRDDGSGRFRRIRRPYDRAQRFLRPAVLRGVVRCVRREALGLQPARSALARGRIRLWPACSFGDGARRVLRWSPRAARLPRWHRYPFASVAAKRADCIGCATCVCEDGTLARLGRGSALCHARDPEISRVPLERWL